ncbi:MAG: choice-of-anchor D domain-containing protein [Verrucomicrobiota bacterium]|nr:choice-of-anchor D domain-containing protein [Verrucomicrobiota bacterium]
MAASDGTYWDRIAVTWEARSGAEGYTVWRSDTIHSVDAVQIGILQDGAATQFDDDGTTAAGAIVFGQTYYYWVRSTAPGHQSKFRQPDGGYAGHVLRYTGFEGGLEDTWTWRENPDTLRSRPDNRFHVALTNRSGAYAYWLEAGATLELDSTALPAGAEAVLLFRYAADGPDTDDNLVVRLSYDDGATWQETPVVSGMNNLRLGFAEYEMPLQVGADRVQAAFRFVQSGGDNSSDHYYIDEVRLVASEDWPAVSFTAPETFCVEGAGATVTIPVQLSRPADARVSLAFSGTATAGEDYQAGSTSLVFTVGGPTVAYVDLTIADDDLAEGPEWIRMALVEASGVKVGNGAHHRVLIRDNNSLSILSADLSSSGLLMDGVRAIGEEGRRMLATLRPDVAVLQDWVLMEGTDAAFVQETFGSGYAFGKGSGRSPNGVVSRWPVSAQGSWTNTAEPESYFYWARLDLPDSQRSNDLVVVSANLAAGASQAATREAQARALTNFIAQAYAAGTFQESDYLVVAGALNLEDRNETALAVLGTVVSDASKPTDLDGNTQTSVDGTAPVDFVLPNMLLERQFEALVYRDRIYQTGMIFDTREWGDHPLPALAADSSADGVRGRPILKIFALGQVVLDPVLSVEGETSPVETDWMLTPNAEHEQIVLVYNTSGDFSRPLAGVEPPETGGTFAGGTVLWKGVGPAQGIHTNLIACQTYYYKAFSYTTNYMYSPGAWAVARTAPPLAPVETWVDPTNAVDFIIHWNPAGEDGAAYYELDVAYSDLSSIGFNEALSEDFTGSGMPSGWSSSGYTSHTDDGYRMGSGSTGGTMSTPSMNLVFANGEAEVSFHATTYGSDSAVPVVVRMSTDDGVSYPWVVYSNQLTAATGTNLTVHLSGCTATTRLQFSAPLKGKRWILGPVQVLQQVMVERIVGYESVQVQDTSLAVTGLTENTSYYYRLRTVGGDTGCASEWLYVGPVTTKGAPRIAVIPSDLNFGRVEKGQAVQATVVVTNFGSASLSVSNMVFTGTGTEHFSVVPAQLELAPGESGPVVVTFLPTAGGDFSVQLILENNTPDQPACPVTILGRCFDPSTANPVVYEFSAMDALGLTNVVTDHGLFNGEVEIAFTMYHITGMRTNVADASFDILGPDAVPIWENLSFTSVSNVQVGPQVAQRFRGTIPGFYPADLGTYTARVSAESSNGYTIVDMGRFTPEATGWLFDDFFRDDVRGNGIGNGWLVMATNGMVNETGIVDQRLEFYGSESVNSGQHNKIAVGQDISHLPYSAAWTNNEGMLSWGFNFQSGRGVIGTFSANSYAGAFILGANQVRWVDGVGQGYAVVIWSNSVQLARFSNGLRSNSGITPLGPAYPFPTNAALAIRVDFNPGSEEEEPVFKLFVREWGGSTPDAFNGSPLAGHNLLPVASISDRTYLDQELKYAGCMWNHATAAPSEATRAVFDDLYFPNAGQGIRMSFLAVDEDVEPPEHSHFNTRGALSLQGIEEASHLSVTGYVADASGVYAASNKWTLFSNAVELATGWMTMSPDEDGGGAGVQSAMLTVDLPAGLFADTTAPYTFRIESTDFDVDREGDSLTATNDYVFYITNARLRTPTDVTVDADGEEVVVSRWNNGGEGVLVLWSPSPLDESVELVQLHPYEVGDAGPAAGSKIVYKGTDSSREFIVPAGSTNFFLWFGTANDAYTGGVVPSIHHPVVMDVYEPGEIVDSFAYVAPITPPTHPDPAGLAVLFNDPAYQPRPETGNEWDGPWTGDVDKWKIHDDSLPVGVTGYPDPVANKLFWQDTSSYEPSSAFLTRKLKTPRSDRTFVAFLMNYQYSGETKFVNMALMSGENAEHEVASFGKQGAWETYAAITIPTDLPGGGNFCGLEADRYELNPAEGNDYAVIGEWNPAEKTFRIFAYHTSQPIPQVYSNAVPIATVSNAAFGTEPITGVRLGAGSGAGSSSGVVWSNELGHVYIDEIRMGSSWDETLLFNFPEVNTYSIGEPFMDGTNRIYRISDGQLAEAGKSFDVAFRLHHRTGITDARFTFLDNQSTNWLFSPMRPLQSISSADYSTWTSRVEGIQVVPERINLGIYTSMVWVSAMGGKQTHTLQSTESGGGATDLFFGEFGEGKGWDKYVEIYNGTGSSVDLSQYYIASQTMNAQKFVTWTNWCQVSSTPRMLEHGHTIVILNGESANDNLQAMRDALESVERSYLISTNNVLAVGGDDPIGLFRKEQVGTIQWLDLCGMADETFAAMAAGEAERYIMRRKEDAEVPRSYPLMVKEDDWDYRRWSLTNTVQDYQTVPPYTNFLATAGLYDRDVGLGGYMAFHVHDDDTDPPVLGEESAVMLKTGSGEEAEDYTALTAVPGETEIVLTGWSFTNHSAGGSLVHLPWLGSFVTNASISYSPAYTNSLVVTNGGTTENAMFGTVNQVASGEIYMRAGDWVQSDPYNLGAWIQFQFDLVKAHDLVFSFAEAGGNYGFEEASLLWSQSGVDGSWNLMDTWEPRTGGASTWASRFVDLSAIPQGAGTLYLRVVLGKNYGGASGTYRMDNIQLTGYPEEFLITDAQLHDFGLHFRGNIYDTNSGIQRASASMGVGGNDGVRDVSRDHGDGFSLDSTMWWRITDLSKAEVTRWYEESRLDGLPVRISVWDDDQDRLDDATDLRGHFGNLRVVDDDEEPPQIKMETLRPVGGGVVAQWCFASNTLLLPTRTDASVLISALGTMTTNGTRSTPKFSAKNVEFNQWAVYHSGWHVDSKYWFANFTPESDMSITNLSFETMVGSTNGPTYYEVQVITNDTGEAVVVAEFDLAQDRVWSSLDQIKTWTLQNHELDVVLPGGRTSEIRLMAKGGNRAKGVGATWYLYNLVFEGKPEREEGRTEVSDDELARAAFWMKGALWDPLNGLVGTNSAKLDKRPRFSLRTPRDEAYMTDVPLRFTSAAGLADGEGRSEEQGAFENPMEHVPYVQRVLGEYRGQINAWDADDDRTNDDLQVLGDIAFYAVDNDVTPPGSVGQLFVNGQPVPDVVTRDSVAWTNEPGFLVSFSSVAEDQEPTEEQVPIVKSRGVSGVGEYRVAVSNEGDTVDMVWTKGKPYAVATTNGALANYGFEHLDDQSWTMDGGAGIQSALVDATLAWEGTNSLKMAGAGSLASQWIRFQNEAGVAPKVAFQLHFVGPGSLTVKMEGFCTTSGQAEEAGSLEETVPAAAEWTAYSFEPSSLGNGSVDAIRVSLVGGTGINYVDDIRFSVDVGESNKPAMHFVAGPEHQGLNPQYLYAMDADNNRPEDALPGEAKPFYIAYDITPPTLVAMRHGAEGASTEAVDDPTTQFDLRWSPDGVGPDDSEHHNHPQRGQSGASLDLFSPWQSYKVYYGTFDPLEVPETDDPYSKTGFIYTNFIASGMYKSWNSKMADSPIEDSLAVAQGRTHYAELASLNTNSMRLYDLDFDQDYVVVMVGVDRAGNEGPADENSWATNNTIRFSLTRGWSVSKETARAAFTNAVLDNPNTEVASALAWTAAGKQDAEGVFTNVTKDYDLIHWDASSFQERTNNNWQLVGTVRSNWFVDDGGHFKGRGQLRFYRASYKDRWRRTNIVNGARQRPLVSEEVYAMHNVVLSSGPNFVALHGLPYTNTLEGVFGGTETFPGAANAMQATRVEFYLPGTNAVSTEQYWLSTDGRWRQGNEDVTTVLQPSNFFTRGFSITLPEPLPAAYESTTAQNTSFVDSNGVPHQLSAMVWSPIMQVPTNSIQHVIHCGQNTRGAQALVYNLVALQLPVRAHPRDMNLQASGFTGGAPGTSDLIYTIDTTQMRVRNGHTIYCDFDGVWRFVPGSGNPAPGQEVPNGFFAPNDAIIIVSKNGGLGNTWTWTYDPAHFYTLPTRWMGE